MLNILTVDVEEYFHPTEVQPFVDSACWESLPSRVVGATRRVLKLLDRHQTKATFFPLGWVADRHPELLRTIRDAGHEIGCHSYAHRLVYELTPSEFRSDTQKACQAIEDAAGVRPRLYRAPSYSITARSMWALDILAELGFRCDSSIYPIAHNRYGIPGFERHAHSLPTAKGPILEVPVATARLSKRRVTPVGGGAYLRLFPYRYMAAGIRRLNEQEGEPACIYIHPWELDPDTPRLATRFVPRLRTYAGLAKMEAKMDRLLSEFRFTTLSSIHPMPQLHHGSEH